MSRDHLDGIPHDLHWLFDRAVKAYRLDLGGIHGPRHWRSVFRNAVEIAEADASVDPLVVRVFAILHDCQRENDHRDHYHGHRAASFLREEVLPDARLELSDRQAAQLVFAMRYHNRAVCGFDRTIGACFDADRLDLGRVGTEPHPGWLSTEAAREILRTRNAADSSQRGRR